MYTYIYIYVYIYIYIHRERERDEGAPHYKLICSYLALLIAAFAKWLSLNNDV